ncbi:hypothetical protein SSX86_018710 [Deinandra increscens subsp. villosa]|uniref:MLO-like protein n=1 Tax=Deinandra increscens subsp. villosa TaxID=3103831 RepID=A0AAP0GSD7_9ASTR
MGGSSEGRSLEQTPTWAVAVVCLVMVATSIVIEVIIHKIEQWFKKKKKRGLYESLEKIKAELMLLGFISLLLTVATTPITQICISERAGSTWHPCSQQNEQEEEKDEDETDSRRRLLGYNPGRILEGSYGYNKCSDMVWMEQARSGKDSQRFRFTRDTSFGRRHMSSWSQSPILLWIVCFFRQFYRSVPKVDYLTLRHGFITAHLTRHSHSRFDFQKYINRSLEEDFKVVVAISPQIWLFVVVFLIFNTHGWYSYLWLPFIPLIIVLLVGTKLQVIITKMGLKIQDRGEVVKGVPVVHPHDGLFWFNRPRLLLYLLSFVLFQNAFQLAFFSWTAYQFGFKSCYHEHMEDNIITITMGVLIQVLCSYVTLPLYALVTQMGSSMRPTIFNDRVASALRKWHHTARKNIKHNKKSGQATATPSRPVTPSSGHDSLSPIHLLGQYRSSNIIDSLDPASLTRLNMNIQNWHVDGSSYPTDPMSGGDPTCDHEIELGYVDQGVDLVNEPSSSEVALGSDAVIKTGHEVVIEAPQDSSLEDTTPIYD